jgi:uncharacterized protein
MKIFNSYPSKLILGIEFLFLCIAVPGYIIYNLYAPYMMAFLWGAALYCAVIYYRTYFTGWKDLWRWDAVTWINIKPILIRWGLACLCMLIFIYFYAPDRMFNLWQREPAFVFILFILYPALSALPQEFIFCSFFFKRYELFFGNGIWMVIASALVFAYAHILYINPVAPALSLLGGYIFANSFRKTKSLAIVTIEHGLYGNALFLIGLGWYFYGGSIAIN